MVMHYHCMHVTFLFTFNHGFLYKDLAHAVKICVLLLFLCFSGDSMKKEKKIISFLYKLSFLGNSIKHMIYAIYYNY